MTLPITIVRQRSAVAAARKALVMIMAAAIPTAGWSLGSDRDFEDKPWTEVEAKLPPFPQAEHLLPFYVSATTDNKFFIDGQSLAVGSDGVVRFTLVIVSPAGAENISYEGIRCATAEQRVYAFGRSDKTWSKARRDQWTTIKNNALNRHHAELHAEYFCTVGVVLRDAEDVRKALQRGGHPSLKQMPVGRQTP